MGRKPENRLGSSDGSTKRGVAFPISLRGEFVGGERIQLAVSVRASIGRQRAPSSAKIV